MKLRHLFTSILMLILVGCETATEPSTLGSVRLSITLNDVGTLAKASTIELQTLYLEMTKGATTIEDTIPLSGNSEVLVSQSYVDMSEGIWALKVESRDGNSEVIHADSTEFTVIADFLVDVNLALASKYSMLIANFLGISDVVYRCELMVDDVMVADTTFPTRDELDFNLSLDYDYLVTGETHTIKLDAYGAYEGNEYLFYTADTTVDIVAGVDQTYELDLQWVGPYGGLTGDMAVNVLIGESASITMNGKFPLPGNVLVDIDGNKYKTILLGNQIWMTENLKVTKFRDSTSIPNVTGFDWVLLNTGAYQSYNDNPEDFKTYGYLYNWFAVNGEIDGDGQKDKEIAPEGWHVPSDDEWKQLEMYLGMSQAQADISGYRGTNEGSKLAGQEALWYAGLLTSNVDFGKTGLDILPAGQISGSGSNGSPEYRWSYASLWTSTEKDNMGAYYRRISNTETGTFRDETDKILGFSIRCVKD